jgi:hypothetical protein
MSTKPVKIQWHAYFAQVMEKVCTRRNFLVEREQEVAKMPLKIDLIVIRKKDIEYTGLKPPYSYFNDINVIEFKSKTDVFDWNDLYQLEIYGRLYGLSRNIEARNKISFWSVASHFTEKYHKSLKETGVKLEQLDRGLSCGTVAGFDYYETDLVTLPFTKEYYPFHLFSKNEENVRKLLEKSIDDPVDGIDYKDEMIFLYNKMYREVLIMKLLDPFEAGCDEEGLKDLFLGEPLGDRLMKKWKKEIIKKIGKDEVISELGEDELLKTLITRLGKKKLQEMLDKTDQNLKD